jgi:hypothetical protein
LSSHERALATLELRQSTIGAPSVKIDRTFSLEQAAQALLYLETPTGKVVLTVV